MRKKTILVTGGSKGIGAEIIKRISNTENNVILNYNTSKQEAEEIKKELQKKEINIEIYKADIKNKLEIDNMVKYCIEKFGGIDVLINNAGISQIKLFTDLTEEDWNNMINTNLMGAAYLTQKIVPYMINQKNGCIINISSIWGEIGASCEVHYSIAKAGLDGMTKALAKELGPSNIRVNSIAPGMIATNMNKKLSVGELEDIIEEIPLGRIGSPKSIANCIKWLVEDDYTTGQVISINGGWKI